MKTIRLLASLIVLCSIHNTWAQTSNSFENGHEMVDLGLSVKWATCNIGAKAPYETGDYCTWGKTNKVNENSTSTDNYTESGRDFISYTDIKIKKYNTIDKYGEIDNKTILELKDDVAQVQWRGHWRMPTKEEYEELMNNCTFKEERISGTVGILATSKINGNSVYFPCLGYRSSKSIIADGLQAFYWTSSLDSKQPYFAWQFKFNRASQRFGPISDYRFNGCSVRPVWSEKVVQIKLAYEEYPEDHVYLVVQDAPSFPEGYEALEDFIKKNLKRPDGVSLEDLNKRTIFTFIVEPDGRLTNFEFVRSVNAIIDKEILRVFGMMPRWNPGQMDGKPVRCKYTFPLIFNYYIR